MTTATPALSKDILVGMLRKGSTGNQILDILDVIASEDVQVDENVETELVDF